MFKTPFSFQDTHILQCSGGWEIMWHQQKQTHYAHSTTAHTQTPHTLTYIKHTHKLLFVTGRRTAIHLLPVNTADVTGSQRRRKHQQRRKVDLFPNSPWVVPLPGLSLTSISCTRVSCFGPRGTGADPPLHTMLVLWRPLPALVGVFRGLGGAYGPLTHRPFCGYGGGLWFLELEVLFPMMTLGSRLCGCSSGGHGPGCLETFGGDIWGKWPLTSGLSGLASLVWLGGVKQLVLTTEAMWTGEGELVRKMMRSSSARTGLTSPKWAEPWKLPADSWLMPGVSSLRSILAVRRSICWTTWIIRQTVNSHTVHLVEGVLLGTLYTVPVLRYSLE